MKLFFLIATLLITIIVGNILYYFSAIFKKVGSTSIEEINAPDFVVSDVGELEEIPPTELATVKEVSILNTISKILFLISANLLWLIMGITAGRIAFLFNFSEFYKLVLYFLVYFIFLRIPFGVANRTIEKSYEVKVMPEKLVIVISMILGYFIGINTFESLPKFLTYHFFLVE